MIKFLIKNKKIMFLFIIDVLFYLSLFVGLWGFGLLGEKFNWGIHKTTILFLLFFMPILFLKLYKEITKAKNKKENIYGKKK